MTAAALSVGDIFLLRVFEEPLVPIGASPTSDENAALANAVATYGQQILRIAGTGAKYRSRPANYR